MQKLATCDLGDFPKITTMGYPVLVSTDVNGQRFFLNITDVYVKRRGVPREWSKRVRRANCNFMPEKTGADWLVTFVRTTGVTVNVKTGRFV